MAVAGFAIAAAVALLVGVVGFGDLVAESLLTGVGLNRAAVGAMRRDRSCSPPPAALETGLPTPVVPTRRPT